MSRNVCSSRSRCRRLIGRTTLFAFPLAVCTGSLTAQSTIPFQPDLVLTYVMRNLSDTADREFNSTIVLVTPEETEFAVDMLGAKKELGNHWRMIETEPKGYNCGT